MITMVIRSSSSEDMGGIWKLLILNHNTEYCPSKSKQKQVYAVNFRLFISISLALFFWKGKNWFCIFEMGIYHLEYSSSCFCCNHHHHHHHLNIVSISHLFLCHLSLMVPGLIGKVDFTVRHLSSSATNFPSTWSEFSNSQPCVGQSARQVSFGLL